MVPRKPVRASRGSTLVRRLARLGLLAAVGCGFVGPAAGSDPHERTFQVTETREPCRLHEPLRMPFFGDTHVHTALSQDASTQGTRSRPTDAYRFARGEPLAIQPYDEQGEPLRRLRLSRARDFAIVTDHAEQLGEVHVCSTPGLEGHDSWVCRIYRRWPRAAFFLMNWKSTWFDEPTRFGFCGEGGRLCLDAALTPWAEIQSAAEGAYDRSAECRFTTFVGYEWTGAQGARNLHRNVVFRNDRVPRLPASYYEAPSAEQLWQRLEDECIAGLEGCDALAIPHNSNLSGGLMFETEDSDGNPITRAWAEQRARIEPLVEIVQHKGESECAFEPGTADELCAFEKLPYGTFQGKFVPWLAAEPDPRSFVRWALKQGLRLESELGANPFPLGFVGSTDTHLGAAGRVDETAHVGHGGAGKMDPDALPVGLPDDLEMNPGGLAVIWAEENSRDALFEAMRRRETYATSGPRIRVRLFAGFGLAADLCQDAGFVAAGYAAGVPMGGRLEGAQAAGRPLRIAERAESDPGPEGRPGNRLQRIQIVKGWLDAEGTHEEVIDVAGDATAGGDVDEATCRPSREGTSRLCASFEDPDFDPGEPAFYYARVLETPSCRWSAHVCRERGVDCQRPETLGAGLEPCCSEDHRPLIQERAWTSPVWILPGATARP